MIDKHEKGIVIRVHVTPRSKHRSISIKDEPPVVHVRVRSAPIQGRANRELIKLFAKRLGISTAKLTIISGISSPRKIVLIEGLDVDQVIQALRD